MSEPAACEYIVALAKDRIYLHNFSIWNESSAYMRVQTHHVSVAYGRVFI